MFRSDQPIQSGKEDILGRHLFAVSLAKSILSYSQKDSLSIGLFGAWGTGKTSIINMALEEMQNAEKDGFQAPIVIKFNPWNFSDQNQLIAQFFKELSLALNRVDKGRKHTKLGQAMQAYAGFFEPLKYLPVVSPAGEVASAIKTIGVATEKAGQAQSKDLPAIKAELNRLLANLETKILIVIDDIDRLNNNEIRQIFQLVKSLADFPQTVYLLSFDKEVIINALKKVQEGSGTEYLEKVVQVPFEVPKISEEEVTSLLFSQIDEIIRDIPEERWDSTYWGNIYYSGLRHFFKNIRDVNRYINALKFGFGIIKEEVNPIDFIALTAIQVFLPDLYCGIRDNKDVFAGTTETGYGDSEKSKVERKARLDEILETVTEPSRETLMDFLKRLFPKLENIGYSYSFLETWRKDGRICSPDAFDAYFRLSLPKGELSQNEIKRVLETGSDSALFTKELLRLNEEGKVIRFLERLEDYTKKDIPESNIAPIVTALMDVGDLFPEAKRGFLGTDTPMRILRIFYQLSRRYDDKQKRFELFETAIKKANKSLYTIVHDVSVQCQEHGKYSLKEPADPEEKRTVTPDQLAMLEKLAYGKIRKWARNSNLSKHNQLAFILYMWDHWGEKNDIQKFIKRCIKSDMGLVNFLSSFVGEGRSHGMDDYVGKITYRIDLKNIERLLDVKSIEPRIRKIRMSAKYNGLDDRQKRGINLFLDAFDGKKDDDF